MANSVLKLTVDASEYDAKIKKAAEGLQQYAQKCHEAGGTMEYLDDGVLEFVQALGKMETESTKSRQQLREMSNAVTDLTMVYRGLSDVEKQSPFGQELASGLEELTKRASDIKDAMADVDASIKNAASDTRVFDQISSAATGLTATFQTAQGAAKLFGLQLDDNVEVIAKLQAAMAVTSGLQQLQGLLQKQSALMQGVNALQAEFNILAKANPYVLLATGAAAVVAAYAAWASNAKDAEKAQKALNAEIDNTKNAISQIDKDTDFSVGIAQASGKSWEAIHELRLEAARTKLQLADMNYDKLAASGNASAEQMKQAAEMQKAAWDNVMKVLNEGTIHDVQRRNGTGPFATKGHKTKQEDTNFAADSIMAQEKEVQRLTDAWNRASGAMRDGILKDLDAAKKKLEAMKNESNPLEGGALGEITVKGSKMRSVNKAFSDDPINFDSINTYVSGVKDALKNADLGSDLYNSLTEKISDASTLSSVLQQAMASGVAGADLTTVADEIKQKLLEGDISEDAWQEFLDKLNEKIEDADLKLVFDVDTKTITTAAKQQEKEAKEMAKDWQAAGTAIQAVGNAMNQIEDPAAKVLGTIAQAVATMALSYSQASLATAHQGWGWIAFAATGLATMLTSIAAIKNATSGFASGGIYDGPSGFVPGNKYSGDLIPANGGTVGLNSGELILNRAQQGIIAQELEGGNFDNLQLDARVSAEDIIFILNNNANRRGYKPFINE